MNAFAALPPSRRIDDTNFLRIAGLVAGVVLFCNAQAAAPLLPEGACAIVKKAVARRNGLPESGPPGLGWFCDITPSKDSRLLLVALRTSRPMPYNNLVGWYAVERASGVLYKWDVKQQRTQQFDGLVPSRSGR